MKRIFLIMITAFSVCLNANASHEDSLRNIITSTNNDSLRIMVYSSLAFSKLNKPAEVLQVISEMREFCDGLKDEKWKALCKRKLGTLYHRLNYFDKALEYYIESAAVFEKLSNKDGIANCYNNIANAYASKGQLTLDKNYYERAIEFHLKCIKTRRESDTSQLSNSYNNIAIVYMYQGQFDLALEYLNKAYKIFSAIPEGAGGVDMVTINLGDLYLKKALKDRKPEDFEKAMGYFKNRMDAYKGSGANDRQIKVLSSIGQILCETGKCREAMKLFRRAMDMSLQIKNKGSIMETSFLLAEALEKQGDLAGAMEYMKLYTQTKDSLVNERNANAMEQMQALYESNEKDKEIKSLSNENEIQSMKVNRQRTALLTMIGGLALLVIVALLLFNRYNIKRKANVELARAYQKIEIKNTQITDSINYARRIQSAILPPHDAIKAHLKNHFIFYSPKDIVSGDFYWFTYHGNASFFAVADCTGHGVPGALMSMIGNTLLNEIVNQKNITDPAEILYHLNEGVIKALRQSGVDIMEQDDGMDICVCCLDDKKKNELKYATANLSIYVRTNGVAKELKGDIFSIGGGLGSSGKMFQTKTELLNDGDAVIMSTDGYYDQFGGNNNSKFLVSNFENLITQIDFVNDQPQKILKEKLESWKGQRHQTDDVLVAGFII